MFSNSQLSHAAPGRNFNNHNGFIWAWKQKQYQVKKVLFDFWKEDNSARITMSIDLDERYITLDKIEGDVSSIQIEEVLKNNLDIFENRQNKSRIIYYFKKYFLKIIIAIIAGLIVTYVAYKSGWNK